MRFGFGRPAPSDHPNIRVGAGQVVRGIDYALVGMRPGGERVIVLPPQLAHGRAQVMVFRLNMQAVRAP